MKAAIRRELRVAFSRKAQPLAFRIGKWIVAVGVTALVWGTPYLWWWLGGAVIAGLAVHFLWRRKTQGWTRPWGGWNDIQANDP